VQEAAQRLGVEIVRTWSGDVSSKAGKNVKRKDLTEMLAECRKHKSIKYLIVDEPDRFMRSIDEAFHFEVEFRMAGVKVWYARDDELNTDDMTAKMMKFMKYFTAEGSNVERQRKSINGHKAAVKEGRYTFPPLPGYKKSTRPGVHELDPLCYSAWQSALREVSSRLYTPSEALKRLNGALIPLGKPKMRIDKFINFITNPYYYGAIVVGKQVNERCEKGLHPTLITKEEHESILEVLDLRPNRQIRKLKYNPEFPLNKVLEHDCDERAPFTGSFQGNGQGKHYPKYRCRRCNRQYHRSEVHEQLTVVLASLDYDGAQREEFISALAAVWREKQQDSLQQVKTLQKRLDGLKSTKSNLVRELAASVGVRKEDIAEELENIRRDISLIESDLLSYANVQDDLIEFVKFSLEYTNKLKDDWWELDQQERLQCQQLLFPGGITFQSDKRVGTGQISPLYRLASNKKDLRESRKSLLVELQGIAPWSAGLSL
jgi:DNA invertase Pin-like site-specific DNA recombinase